MIDQETEFYALNESSLTIVFGNVISYELAEKVLLFDKAIHSLPFQGFVTTVPAYASLTIYYNPNTVFHSGLPGKTSYEKVKGYLSMLSVSKTVKEANKRQINIPVCYELLFGPDLEYVSSHCKLDMEELIAIHSSASYTVYMIGFVPGFAYMGGMDNRLSTPRKQQPRSKVPAGAVGIAGGQTGIYPLDIPGGWQIIGRTPLTIFDSGREDPSFLKAGDEVQFRRVTADEFHSLKS